MAIPVYVRSSRDKFNPFLNTTREMVNNVISERREDRCCVGRVPVPSYNFGNPFVFVPVATPVYSPTIYSPSRNSDGNNGARLLVGLVAAAIGGVAIFYTGQAIQQMEKVGEELQEIRDFRNSVATDNTLHKEYKLALEKVADCKERIFIRIRTNAILNLVATIVIVAAAALAIVGAIINIPAMMMTGGIVLIAGCGAVILKWGINSGSDRTLKQTESLKQALEDYAKLADQS